MIICIAQTCSEKGNIQLNIQNHLELIQRAIKHNADLIIFPELSITNYEPSIARKLVTAVDNSLFNPFLELADRNKITIGLGMPTNSTEGINISMLIFQPNHNGAVYSKQILHPDELPYFVCGNKQYLLNIKGKKIAFGICYETLQGEHFKNAHHLGADIYIASVAKSKDGIVKAYKYFSKTAITYKTPILMSNCIGPCDNFISVGQSAIWNKDGHIIGELDDKNQGLLIYDTVSELTGIEQI
ncbi:carbon-nitrogen hydrolase family protein [uncultured Cyclobacterium sp.]|uniref:carbon-nitrogen hydrolase family protein n=1 Tax=uncultured Cyclobacterium sp. TaxID=453820 RepID=UPI0030EF85DC|tara:strand:+ start:45605 stop:46333 length:729 start_codon:yes stop_codon:yes gene_type:complete